LIVIPEETTDAEPVSLGLVIGIAVGFIVILGGSIGLYLCHIKNVKRKKLMAKMKKNKGQNPDEIAA
jgi:actin-related protein